MAGTKEQISHTHGMIVGAYGGGGFGDVVKTTVFLVNLSDFAAMNEVYAKYFTADFPARSTVQVTALPKGAQVEIEVIAHF